MRRTIGGLLPASSSESTHRPVFACHCLCHYRTSPRTIVIYSLDQYRTSPRTIGGSYQRKVP
eukprot:1383727-Rhodomonas_salina.2